MELQPSHKKILEYLGEYGSANTFKLSRDLKIERGELISLVEGLTKEGLTKFRAGTVIKGDKPVVDKKIIETEEISKHGFETSETQSVSERLRNGKAILKSLSNSKEFDKKKPVSEPIVILKKPKKSRILIDKQYGLEKVKEKIRRLEDNWLKKEEELKKGIEDLQTQRGKTAQKLSKEKVLLCQLRKEKRELEESLAVWESSLKQREESVQRNEEDIQKREESVSVAEKRLEREKQRIAKDRVLKEDINKLEATLEDLEKRVSIEKEESKQSKKKKAKPKAVSKRIKKPKRKEQIQKMEKHKLERLSFRKGRTNLEKMRGKAEHFDKKEEPKLEEQGYEKIGLGGERIKDTSISGFESVLERASFHQSMAGGKTTLEKRRGDRANVSERTNPQSLNGGVFEPFDTKPQEHLEPAISEPPRQEQKNKNFLEFKSLNKFKLYKQLEKESFPSLIPDDFEEPEEAKPTFKSRIRNVFQKIRISKTETEKPEIIPKEIGQTATEVLKEEVKDKFHDLIEQEISLLKQKRINEAKEIHLKIKNMVAEIEDINQVKAIVKDWNRVKEFY